MDLKKATKVAKDLFYLNGESVNGYLVERILITPLDLTERQKYLQALIGEAAYTENISEFDVVFMISQNGIVSTSMNAEQFIEEFQIEYELID